MAKAAIRKLCGAAVICLAAATCFGTDTTKPVKVFILAGQSNMQGHGFITKGEGDLETAAKEFPNLKKDGAWVERDDVWYYHKPGKGDLVAGNLKPGLGAGPDKVGPELQFGHVVGDCYDEQVLLIKCAWGGQALGGPFLPPSSGGPGEKYTAILTEVKECLSDLKKFFPTYKGQGYEIAGFFWHQGWNDGCNKDFAQAYEKNMINFIKDIRKDIAALAGKTGTGEDLPFVIATSGMGGPDAGGVAGFLAKSIEPAQMAAAQKSPNCTAVPTRQFQRHKTGRQVSHWYNSGESYVLVGNAAGKAMTELLKKKGSSK